MLDIMSIDTVSSRLDTNLKTGEGFNMREHKSNSLLMKQGSFLDNISLDHINSQQKILIAYATQFGSTAEIADFIEMNLAQQKVIAQSRWIKEIDSLSGYDAVIIGSPIQYDRWRPEAIGFILANEKILADMPVAYYFTCLTLAHPSDKAKKQAQGYADKLGTLSSDIKPVSIGQFAGVLDKSKMPLFYRFMFAGLTAVTRIKQGDYRDWQAIHSWAQKTVSKFTFRQTKQPTSR